jgi:hypothetical protein
MRRREFITLVGGAAATWPLAARAQQTSGARRIGVLMNGAANETVQQSYLAAFVQGLRQLGWTEGQNIRIDVRWNAGDAELARIYAAQLIGLIPDVIMVSSTISLTVIQQATSTVPVVFVQISDPVAQGFVRSLSQPGGNFTGFSLYEFSIGGKWVNLLKEAAPASHGLPSCSIPIRRPRRNSSCARSRPLRHRWACMRSLSPSMPRPTSSQSWRPSRVSRTAGLSCRAIRSSVCV